MTLLYSLATTLTCASRSAILTALFRPDCNFRSDAALLHLLQKSSALVIFSGPQRLYSYHTPS
jgi:hypothetical protein